MTLIPNISRVPGREHAEAITGMLRTPLTGVLGTYPRQALLSNSGWSLEAGGDDQRLAAACNGPLSDADALNNTSQMNAVRSLQQLLDTLTPQSPDNTQHSVPVAVPLDMHGTDGCARPFGASIPNLMELF